MNGSDLKRLKEEVKKMNDDEWRGYLAAKVEDIKEDQARCRKELATTKKCLSKLAIQVARIPAHCEQTEVIKEQDERIDELEKREAASKAVNTPVQAITANAVGESVNRIFERTTI